MIFLQIRIGNHMISSAICKFFKDEQNLGSLKNLQVLIYSNLQKKNRGITYYLLLIYMEKFRKISLHYFWDTFFFSIAFSS